MNPIAKLFRFFLSALAFFLSQNTFSQNWALMHGNCSGSVIPAYSALSVASATNSPGGRSNGATFRDLSGNLWYFGGVSYTSTVGKGYYNDLWKFNLSTNQWSWVKGSNTANPMTYYGTMGVSSSTNDPCGRTGSFYWTDQAGNFWVFGGSMSTSLNTIAYCRNDLWKYTVATNQWTWMSGTFLPNDNGSYGTLGVPSTTNYPSARNRGAMWVDQNGKFWMYGGENYFNLGSHFNDLWMYDPLTNQWTWVHGSSTANQHAVYGTIGVPAASVTPGARMSGTSWTDNSGNLWLFGGVGYYPPNYWGYENDLWKFTIGTGQWTCVRGLSNIGPTGRYSGFGSKESSGNFLLFGGLSGFGPQSDLWRYNVVADQWTQLQQHVPSSSCYSLGIASPNNQPAPAFAGNYWTDNCGNFWIRGGSSNSFDGTDGLNALWKLNLSGAQSTLNPVNSCNGASVILNATAVNPITWYATPGTSSLLTSGNTYVTPTLTPGTYSYYASSSSCTTATIPTEIIVIVHQPTLSILGSGTLCAGASITQTAGGASTYTWNTGSNASLVTLTPSVTTQYSLSGHDSYGCPGSAVKTITVFSLPVLSVSGNTSVCKGYSLLKSVSGASTYSWSVGATGSSISLSPTVNTTYTVYGTSSDNCINKSVFTVSVLPTPVITVNSGTICETQTFTLQPSGAITYIYSSGSATVSPSSTTIYTISSIGTNGCVGVVNSTVTVNPAPAISAANGTVCPGQSFTIQPIGAVSYTFSNGTAVVTPTATSVYSITGNSSAGCLSAFPGTVQVSYFTNPTITVNDGTVCLGQSYSLQVSGANSYSVNGGPPLVTPLANTAYSVIGFNTAGCVSQPVNFSVTVKPLPVITVVSMDSVICAGELATLIAQGATSYSWTTGIFSDTLQVAPGSTTNYTVQGTGANGCVNSGSFQQEVDLCTSLKENSSSQVRIYPNPAKDFMFVELQFLNTNQELSIYSALGTLVLNQRIVQLKIKIYTGSLPKGVYTVRIAGGNEAFFSRKLVID